MSDVPRYRSTGQPAIIEATEKRLEDLDEPAAAIRKLRNANPRNAAMDEIVERRAAERARDPVKEHDAAVKYFDGAYSDLSSNPRVLDEVVKRHNLKAIQAAEKGETVDWFKALPEIGDGIRRELGLPTSDERRHSEALLEMKKARGLE